ncbi:LysR substrate-binding domain-containing protein [Belnapia rosea]|uniref:DNA-binding transcriptional regulator, LysR family n=1 Tax=Belnapia rosea TaxID=938405 RepID=A0A1G6Y108_9PROT|nr:LysR substrate-binding domain-containing protein [Belnapia rosea]SDB72815.1 DNA-binding transcriptional regulator, LysR family [Belnapia rosea]SDD83623.1 DNA-binding transcriptional regulator, LysR family [Belnapia rosea]
MDFRILRRMGHFLAVAEEGHFGRAAARLGVSQPPLTAQIQALEAELGVRLLERTRKGARPTREGEALLPILRRLAEEAKQVESLARELRAGRHAPMAMACVTSALFDYLPPLVRGLRSAAPDSALAVREMDTADAVEALRRGEVDFALARLDRDRPPLRVLPLGADALVAALPEGHALLREGGPLPLSALAGEALVLLPRSISPAYFDRQVTACREAGFEPVAMREVGSAMAQLAFVAAGLGVALVSSGMAVLRPPGVAFRALAGPVGSVGVALVWNGERETEAARAAIAAARRAFPAAGDGA